MINDAYNGTWELIRELCIYEQGEAPLSGIYKITASDGEVAISIEWVDVDKVQHSTSFGGPMDGTEVPIDAPGVTHVTYTRVTSGILDSVAYNGEEEVMYARRVASGDLLTTLQRLNTPNGPVSTFQVYRRIEG